MSMAVETLVCVQEYLSTSYDPDVEFVDGVLVERNVGDWQHSLVQADAILSLGQKYPWLYVVPELRSQTTGTRYRLPDVSVLLNAPITEYLVDAAFVAIEILSKDDRMSDVLEKLAEYEAKGVLNIWVIDPRLRRMFVYKDRALHQTESLLATDEPRIELTFEEILRRL